MKKTFETGTGIFGAGRPKICAPIVAKTRKEIWQKAEEMASLPLDLVEWRVDFYEDVFEQEKLLGTMGGLRNRLGKTALLFTFRTGREGGNREIGEAAYYELNRAAAASGYPALVDVEAFFDEERTREEIRAIQALGSRVIASNHDFHNTPDEEEMLRRLKKMEELGADVAKLAVMPRSRQDVMRLLQVTLQADEELQIPVVTMSMGKTGVISRICGNLTGSAMTFAAVGETSAPGQIPVTDMVNILNIL